MANKEDDYSEHIKLGKANQNLVPRVQAWCKHINIEMVSHGMLADYTGLPIGAMKVTCPHGISRSEAMRLEWVATSFIEGNCIGCPHHEEVSPANYGREVLEQRKEKDRIAAEMELRREELKQQAYDAATQLLATDKITEGSVNRLILDFLRDIRGDATVGAKLMDAASLGPECFSDQAVKVLTDEFEGDQREDCIHVLLPVIQNRKRNHRDIPQYVREAMIKAMEAGSDAACQYFAIEINDGGEYAPVMPLLPIILAIPDYRFHKWRVPNQIYSKRPSYPGVISLLDALLKKAPEVALKAFDSQLQVNEKDTRMSVAETIKDLMPNHAAVLVSLAHRLLHSLELADDRYERSADGAVCSLLSHLYVVDAETVEGEINRYYRFATEEIQLLILGIYERIARLANPERAGEESDFEGFTGFSPGRYEPYVSGIIERLYLAAGDIRTSPDHRREIYDKLGHVIKIHPYFGIQKLDGFLARLTMAVREAANYKPDTSSALSTIEAWGMESVYSSLIREVRDIVAILIEHDPQATYPHIAKTLNSLDSQGDAELKVQLVRTLETFATQYELLPTVIAQLYKHFVDFESRAVRAAAINVLSSILAEQPDSVPDDMIELLLRYAEEEYRIIHKAAVRAMYYLPFSRDERGYVAANLVLSWEASYRRDPKQTDFLKDIFNTLSRAFRTWEDIQEYATVTLLPLYAQSEDRHFSEDMLVVLSHRVDRYPAAVEPFVEAAVNYLQRTWRDHYNDDIYTDRYEIWKKLFEISTEAIEPFSNRLAEVFRSKMGRDDFDACRLLELMSYHGLHELTADLGTEALDTLPDDRSHKYYRGAYRVISEAEKAQACLSKGDIDCAIAGFRASTGTMDDSDD